jgi:hypothetical protein
MIMVLASGHSGSFEALWRGKKICPMADYSITGTCFVMNFLDDNFFRFLETQRIPDYACMGMPYAIKLSDSWVRL